MTSADVERLIREEARRQGVPEDLAVAVARRESGLNPNVGDGSSGEVGVMQVKPATGLDMGVSNLRDLDGNIRAGVAYLKWNYDYLGSWDAAILGYNGGPGNVERGTVSQAAYGYLAWVKQQVPWLFGTQPAPPTVAQGPGGGFQGPSLWVNDTWTSPTSGGTSQEASPRPAAGVSLPLAVAAVLGLAVVVVALD